MTQVGRHGEAAGGRFVEFKLTKIGFGGMTAPEKVHRLFRVDLSRSAPQNGHDPVHRLIISGAQCSPKKRLHS